MSSWNVNGSELLDEMGQVNHQFVSTFKPKGLPLCSLSDVVRNHAKKDGLPDDRNSLTSLANSLKEDRGLAYFAEAVNGACQG